MSNYQYTIMHVEALMSEGEPVPEEHEHPQAIIINVAA